MEVLVLLHDEAEFYPFLSSLGKEHLNPYMSNMPTKPLFKFQKAGLFSLNLKLIASKKALIIIFRHDKISEVISKIQEIVNMYPRLPILLIAEQMQHFMPGSIGTGAVRSLTYTKLENDSNYFDDIKALTNVPHRKYFLIDNFSLYSSSGGIGRECPSIKQTQDAQQWLRLQIDSQFRCLTQNRMYCELHSPLEYAHIMAQKSSHSGTPIYNRIMNRSIPQQYNMSYMLPSQLT